MHHKTSARIQADITLMRLAYEEREKRHESLNHYLGKAHPLTIAGTYILSITVGISGIAILIRHAIRCFFPAN